MRAFQFYEHNSFLHRLNPLTKLAFATVVLLGLTIVVDPITPLITALLTLATIWLLGGIPIRRLLRVLLPVGVLSFGLVWTTVLFYVRDPATHPRTLVIIGPFAVSDQAVFYGLAIVFRLVGYFAASLLFVLTTDPSDFVQALIQKLHISYRFGYGAHAAYRFVPLFDTELATIRAAHRVRGVRDSGGPVARWRQFSGYLIPLLAGSVRTAERVALAMDARGFGSTERRTFYRQSTFGRGDVAFSTGALAILGTMIVFLAHLGWLGRLVPPFIGG